MTTELTEWEVIGEFKFRLGGTICEPGTKVMLNPKQANTAKDMKSIMRPARARVVEAEVVERKTDPKPVPEVKQSSRRRVGGSRR